MTNKLLKKYQTSNQFNTSKFYWQLPLKGILSIKLHLYKKIKVNKCQINAFDNL